MFPFQLLAMLTENEEGFLKYWQDQRLRKKQFLRKLSIGFPFAAIVAAAILVNVVSGWYKQADMEIHSQGSLIIVIIVAVLAIVVFITIFAAHQKWDQNEQHYLELLKKKETKTE